jgi:hypothetical protein
MQISRPRRCMPSLQALHSTIWDAFVEVLGEPSRANSWATMSNTAALVVARGKTLVDAVQLPLAASNLLVDTMDLPFSSKCPPLTIVTMWFPFAFILLRWRLGDCHFHLVAVIFAVCGFTCQQAKASKLAANEFRMRLILTRLPKPNAYTATNISFEYNDSTCHPQGQCQSKDAAGLATELRFSNTTTVSQTRCIIRKEVEQESKHARPCACSVPVDGCSAPLLRIEKEITCFHISICPLPCKLVKHSKA